MKQITDTMHHELADQWKRERRQERNRVILTAVVAMIAVALLASLGTLLIQPSATGWRLIGGLLLVGVAGAITDERIESIGRWLRRRQAWRSGR